MNFARPELEDMTLAPKDGDVIVAVYSDFSGVEAIRYGERITDGKDGWFLSDFSDELCEPEGLTTIFSGWFYPPKIQWPELGQQAEAK